MMKKEKKNVIIVGLLLLGVCAGVPAETDIKPNVILILTDDHGYADLNVQGRVSDVRTPHIDQLAEGGVRCTAGYITAPQCAPSRAGIVSGRYQQKFGLDNNGNGPMGLDITTVADRLQQAGYVTGMVGKWHLSPLQESESWFQKNLPDQASLPSGKRKIPKEIMDRYQPAERGFSEYYSGAYRHYEINYTLEGKSVERKRVYDPRFRVDVQSDAAVTFVERNKDNPFFLYLAYFAPHVPLEAPDKYLLRFPGDMPERRRYALAMLSAVDDGVGRIMEMLRRHDIEDNTLIFFISDNGAPLKLHKEDKPIEFKGGAWDGSLNDPWIGEKGMLSEGGIRVPFVVYWKNHLPSGTVYNRPVISLDASASALSVAEVPLDDEIDGVNILPYLREKSEGDPHDALYWRFWNEAAIRSGDWKYLCLGNGSEWLFDLSQPNPESKNLIGEHPELAVQLRLRLSKWADSLKQPGLPHGQINSQEVQFYNHYFRTDF
jgi:arylsulfatase A-like enzyme